MNRAVKAVACVAMTLGVAWGAHAAEEAGKAPVLIQKQALAGQGLEVLPFPWPKEMIKSGVKQHKDLAVYAGQVTASIYEPADGVLQFKDQPYDEIVHVLHGESTLTLRRLRFFWTQIWGKTCVQNWSG